MQKLIFVLILLCAFGSTNAAFVNATLQDSRIQDENHIYKPGGIIGFSIEGGFFNEAENLIDYTLALGIRRFGYSHSDGDISVSLWTLEFKPFTWSVNYKNFMLEFYLGLGYVFASNNINEDLEEHLSADDARGNHNFLTDFFYGCAHFYGYRLGYRINAQFMVSITANYQQPNSGWQYPKNKTGKFYVGGLGLNAQWNLP